MSSPFNVFKEGNENDCEDINESKLNFYEELKESMQDVKASFDDQEDLIFIKEILNNLNDKSTLCNEKDDCKEIKFILPVKNQSAKNLNTFMNSQNSIRRRLINIKGNVLFNSMNNDSTFSNSPYTCKYYIVENSLNNTLKPERVSSNFLILLSITTIFLEKLIIFDDVNVEV